MTLSETTKLDIVAESKQGEIILAISAAQNWKKNPSMVKDLEKKLRNYIHYIESDQYTQKHGDSPVIIDIMTAHKLSPEAIQLVDKVHKASGIDIKITVMGAFNPFR